MASRTTRSSTRKTFFKYEDEDSNDDLSLSEFKIQEDLDKTGEDSNISHDSDTVVVCTIIEDEEDMNLISEIAVRDNKEPSTIICKFCPKTFKSSSQMRKHQRKCLINVKKGGIIIPAKMAQLAKVNKPNFSCKLCRKNFKFEGSYSSHMLNEHSSLPQSISCKLCIARCPDKETLMMHIEKVHNAPVYECPLCKATFSRGYHVTRHIEQKGCNGMTKVKKFSCKICGAQFSRKDNLMYHLRNNHMASTKKFQCKLCDYGVQNFNTLVRHFKRYHMENVFICDICDARLGSRMAVAKHLETHGDKKYCCGVCKYMSHTIEVMKRHVLIHTKEKPIKCSECDSSFIQVLQLRAHQLKHKRTCAICDEEFKNRQQLLIHMRTHMGKDKLVCPINSCIMPRREFVDEEALDQHLKMHDKKNQIFKCEICNKTYHKEVYLRRHERQHALERPRRCMYCVTARAYGRGDRLLRHLRLRHATVFAQHLASVKQMPVEDEDMPNYKLTKQETDEILSILDSIQDQALQQNGGMPFAGMGGSSDEVITPDSKIKNQLSTSPVMSEQELGDSVRALLAQLIDAPTLRALGAGDDVDLVLQRVIEHCGAEAAQGSDWAPVQRVRENLKLLFVQVLDDDDVRKMLDRHTVDQVVRHMLAVHKQEGDY